MAINFKNYFKEAENLSLYPYQICYSETTETALSVYNDEVESQEIGTNRTIGAVGNLQGKKGTYLTDCIDSSTPKVMAKNVRESALYGRDYQPEFYFDGKAKYRKTKLDIKKFEDSNLQMMRKVALAFSKEARALDPRVKKAEVSLCKVEGTVLIMNSKGLKCKETRKIYRAYVSVYCEDENGEPRSGGTSFSSFTNLADLTVRSHKEIEKAVHSAVDFFQSKPVSSKKYKVVLDSMCFRSLFGFLIHHLNAKSVQKHLSVFEGKMGSAIVSDKLTVLHTPRIENSHAEAFDTDGVPTQDFTVIKKGVLENYFYSLETAIQDKVTSNGCSIGDGNASPVVLTVKPGKLDRDGLLKKMKNGLLITEINGLNSGIDSQTLNYSLPCAGYVVKDGAIEKATSMILISGNLQELFNHVVSVGSDVTSYSGFVAPSILVRDVQVSGQ